MNKFVKAAVCSLVLVFAVMMTTTAVWSQAPEVSTSVHHDVSPPLWSVASQAPRLVDHIRAVHPLPVGSTGPLQPDPALQTSSTVVATPGTALNFAGVGNGDYGFAPNAAPPDTEGAVGATQYVQWVNESFAVFNKSTSAILA